MELIKDLKGNHKEISNVLNQILVLTHNMHNEIKNVRGNSDIKRHKKEKGNFFLEELELTTKKINDLEIRIKIQDELLSHIEGKSKYKNHCTIFKTQIQLFNALKECINSLNDIKHIFL